jgi:hypothetical protein
VLVQLCAAAQAQAQSLRHDVFARPVLDKPAPVGSAGQAAPKPVWNPVLRAVIVAGRDSLANVDGSIVRIGEQIDGYRLVQVREHEAVFLKTTRRYTLMLADIKGADAAAGAPAAGAGKTTAAPDKAADTGGANPAAAEPQVQGAGGATPPAAVPEAQTTNDRQGLDIKRRSQ